MDNQHKKIKGYRDLSEEEIKLMNKIKELGECLGRMVNELNDMPSTDKVWVVQSNLLLKQGIMAAVRSVAKPVSF